MPVVPFRKVLTNSPIYAVGELVQRGSGILLLPLYTRYLDTAEFGAAILSTLIAGFAAGIFSLHIQTAVVRFTYDAPDDSSYLSRLYGTTFAFTTVLSLLFTGLTIPLVNPVLGIIGASNFWLPYAYLAIIIAATSSSYGILQRIMQSRHEAQRFVAQQWLFFFLGAGVTVTLMVGFGVKGLSLVIGTTVTNVVFHLYSLFYVIKSYGLHFDTRLLRECLGYSIPLLPNRFAGLIPRVADRVFLTSVSVGAAGLYSVGYRLGEGLSYISGGFLRAHLPWFYASMNEGESGHKQVSRVARQTIFLVSILGLLMALFAEEAIRVTLGVAYHGAWVVVPLAVFAIVFNVVKEFWLRTLTYQKSTTKYVPIATYTFAALSVGLTALLVPIYGIFGAAAAILVARIISSFVMLFFSLRTMNIGYPVWEIYGIATAALGLSLVAYLPISGLLLVKVVLAITVLGIAAAWSRTELTQALRLVRQRSMATP